MRMHITLILVLSLSYALASSASIYSENQSKPIKTDIINTYFKGPPDSMSEAITRTDAVIRATVVTDLPRDLDLGTLRGARVMIEYRFKVLEVMHSLGVHEVPSDEITVLREGGDRDRGSHIERVVQEGFPPFWPSHEYVLFLKWDTSLDAWIPEFGPNSVFDVQTGTVASSGKANLARALAGRPTAELLSRIRNHGRR